MKAPINLSAFNTNVLLNATPYQLSGQSPTSTSFYLLLDIYSGSVCTEGHRRLGSMVRRYRGSLAYLSTDFKQNQDESLLDLIMLSVLWNEYKGCWSSDILLKEKFLKKLYHWRSKFPEQKERLDSWRGRLAQKWIDRPSKPEIEITLSNVKRFNLWLSATNEYNQEVLRFKSWMKFMETIPETEVLSFLHEIVDFGKWFKTESNKALKNYTYGVASFLNEHHENYKGKEDFFFTGKKEVEYHLNMVGASIMNRSLRAEFIETEHKVLLLPSCMKKSENCQSIEIMNGTVCRHCSPDCNISKTSKAMLSQGVHTFIIQHSSGFSSYLKQWANQNKVGLIGTACTLNLLSGGFEMKRLGIPAQCIFLNYSGCRKHWNKEGMPTNIDLLQLKNLVAVENSRAV